MSEAAKWKEFESRASSFSADFKNASNERSEAQLFWIRFLEIFGISLQQTDNQISPSRAIYSHRPCWKNAQGAISCGSLQ